MTDEKKTPSIVPVEELVRAANSNDGILIREHPDIPCETIYVSSSLDWAIASLQDAFTADRKRCREAWEAEHAVSYFEHYNKGLRDTLHDVRAENNELKAKIATLEAKDSRASKMIEGIARENNGLRLTAKELMTGDEKHDHRRWASAVSLLCSENWCGDIAGAIEEADHLLTELKKEGIKP